MPNNSAPNNPTKLQQVSTVERNKINEKNLLEQHSLVRILEEFELNEVEIDQQIDTNSTDAVLTIKDTPDELIDLVSKKVGYEAQLVKVKGAQNIALIITWGFIGSLTVLLVGGFVLLYFFATNLFISEKNVTTMGLFIKDVALPILQTIGTFLGTLFTPLMAFILGFYFGKSRD